MERSACIHDVGAGSVERQMFGVDQIDLYYFGRGHTDGDAWVVFPALRVVHAGDIFSGKSVPLIDTSNGGSLLHISDSLKKAHDGIKNVDIVINGHTPSNTTWTDLAEYADFTADLVAYGRAGFKAGKTPEQLAAAQFIAVAGSVQVVHFQWETQTCQQMTGGDQPPVHDAVENRQFIAQVTGNLFRHTVQRTLDLLRAEERVVVRYVDNPNGSLRDIAGICNEKRNVMGMMPHPERAADALLGSTEGRVILESMVASLVSKAGK